MENSVRYLSEILKEIERKDPLHAKTLKQSLLKDEFFDYLRNTIYAYFERSQVSAVTVADDYLHMIDDMRVEGIKFIKTGEYSCKSEAEAYEKVYSKPEVMSYYMNALMISQLLWPHHFYMLKFFSGTMKKLMYRDIGGRILDIGAGHGLFSDAIKQNVPRFAEIDILDISKTSLEMTKRILGVNKIKYVRLDLKDYTPFEKYDLIIMGEILEHVSNPVDMLYKASTLLDDGVIWLTVPTNAPAIDHISLFRTEQEVFDMIDKAGMQVIDHYITNADLQTKLVGAFCVKK